MIDIYEIRHRNVRMLVSQLEREAGKSGDRAGGLVMMAAKLNKASAQVSHFASEEPIKNIGDKIAREIEAAFGLEYAWMDWAHWDDEAGLPDRSQSVRLDPVILQHTIHGLRRRAAQAREAYTIDDMENDPEGFISAYELFLAMKPKPVPSNVPGRRVHAEKSPQGAEEDGRGTGVPVPGATKRKMGTTGGRKA